MTYVTAEARQELLDAVAVAIGAIGRSLASLTAAYELLDENAADRLETELFGPVQTAYGRAQRTHATFAVRYGLPTRTFAPAPAQTLTRSVAELLELAGEAAATADEELATLQDSLKPVEVGDPELRAGLSEVRRLLSTVPPRAQNLMRTVGR